MPKLSSLTQKSAVEKAIEEFNLLGQDAFLKKYGFGHSRNFLIQKHGALYDSKAIFGAAFGYQFGTPLEAKEFSGGARTVKRVLEKLGYDVVTKDLLPPAQNFQVNHIYSRRNDIHSNYGGQEQGGISTPAEVPAVFLFTGDSGESFGYGDQWTEDGVFLYTGEGQVGDMKFTGGNSAIRDHVKDGKDLLLFQSLGKRKGQRFIGVFVCNSWEIAKRPDRNAEVRDAIIFHLVPVAIPQSNDKSASQKPPSLEILRKRAFDAARPSSVSRITAGRNFRERSEAVKDYVLARAAGICEGCMSPAPFSKKDGSPYLEPHHIKRLADDGPDDPRWVIAVCPTCHRRVHHGADGVEWNAKLLASLSEKEGKV